MLRVGSVVGFCYQPDVIVTSRSGVRSAGAGEHVAGRDRAWHSPNVIQWFPVILLKRKVLHLLAIDHALARLSTR